MPVPTGKIRIPGASSCYLLIRNNAFVVEDRWTARQMDEVARVVSSIIANAQSGKLPRGFDLMEVLPSRAEPRAICIWKAESREALESLLVQSTLSPVAR